ncbi:MAG: glutamate--tRNA ligase [Patescibacteria group bacterium]
MPSEKNNIRLRFAPSPTGFLHIGNLRSALFGYLLAKSWGGRFVLRIEDTDQKREVGGAVQSLLDILGWVGIRFDEGPAQGGDYGPYIQTERLEIYKKYCDELLARGQAYRCFCTAERLAAMRADQEANKQAPRYDRLCRGLSETETTAKIAAGEKFVIRQKMPLQGEIAVRDELRGEIKFRAADLDDQVLIKSDGIPTYQFANIVDDHLMEISHVTRGDEWLPSFPKNILLYQSFGWTPPKFIHLPLLLNPSGGKLSKRQGDVFVEDYRIKGYLPEAIINFCALLGWHPKSDQEIWSLAELEKGFSLEGLGASPAVFDPAKLDYYNSYYIRRKPLNELADLCAPYLAEAGRPAISREQLEKFVGLSQDRLKKLSDITELTGFLFQLPDYEPETLRWKNLTLAESLMKLKEIATEMKKIPTDRWTKADLEPTMLAWIKEREGKNGDYLWPLRVALTGLKNSPGPFEVAEALGFAESWRRLELALKILA